MSPLRRLVACLLTLTAPVSARAQATPRPMPYEDVLEFALLESPGDVLRDISIGNRCFEFALSSAQQQQLLEAARRRDPQVSFSSMEPVFAYIRNRPCARREPPPPPTVAPQNPIRDRGLYVGFVSDLDAVSEEWRSLGLLLGGWAAPTVDVVGILRYGTYGEKIIESESVSSTTGSLELSLRWWVLPGEYPVAVYLQGGAAANLQRQESSSYLGRYAGAGVTGGGGVGVFLTSRLMLSLDYQGQTVWSLEDDEQGFSSEKDGSFVAALVRLGITAFW